ncbi:hypothetical protein C8R44DRAFT_863534 [Mycena epipterygia]|nr:hypothetical protein C8R44DRAFT_863534 [Mycena epipterygia]
MSSGCSAWSNGPPSYRFATEIPPPGSEHSATTAPATRVVASPRAGNISDSQDRESGSVLVTNREAKKVRYWIFHEEEPLCLSTGISNSGSKPTVQQWTPQLVSPKAARLAEVERREAVRREAERRLTEHAYQLSSRTLQALDAVVDASLSDAQRAYLRSHDIVSIASVRELRSRRLSQVSHARMQLKPPPVETDTERAAALAWNSPEVAPQYGLYEMLETDESVTAWCKHNALAHAVPSRAEFSLYAQALAISPALHDILISQDHHVHGELSAALVTLPRETDTTII